MRLLILILLLTLCSYIHAGIYSKAQINSLFSSYVKKYNKVYTSSNMMQKLAAFTENLEFITKVNAQKRSYKLEINNFADWSAEEFKKLDGVKASKNVATNTTNSNPNNIILESAKSLPASVNWIDKGILQPVQSQGACGSCWAFAATAVFEAHHALFKKESVKFSEQYVVDCASKDQPTEMMGCNGAKSFPLFKWLHKNNGLCTEAEYGKYTPSGKECKPCKKVGDIPDWYSNNYNENLIKHYVNRAPVYGEVFSNRELKLYKEGIFDNPEYKGEAPNHAINIVGYGTENGQDYWIIRNSWGDYWGEKGYFRIARGKNMHGIANLIGSFGPRIIPQP